MRLLLFFFSIVSFLLLVPLPVQAQDTWIINGYDADLTIQKNGELSVTESLVVDFGGNEKHGIFRFIPYVYTDDTTGDKTYTEVEVLSVVQDDQEAEYDVYKENDNVVIKIGDPDETISGTHSYQISYVVRGVLRNFDTYDELYWNVIGPYWEVPIEHASAIVRFPEDAIQQFDCFVGTLGSKFNCESELISQQNIRFYTVRTLNPYEAFTVVVGYKPGIVPIIKVERPKSVLEKLIEWPSVVTFVVVTVFGVGIVLYFWLVRGRDYWNRQQFVKNSNHKGEVKPIGGHETVVVEYTPPEKLPPAVLGVLIDERAHTHDVTATIIDLATRGFLTITEVPKKWMFGSIDYEIKRLKKDTTVLLSYEKLLLDELFDTGDKVKVSSLKKSFYTSLKKVKDELYKEVTMMNLFPTNPEHVRSKYLLIGFFLLIGGISVFIFTLTRELIFLADIGLGVSVSGLLFVIFSSFMPRRTAYGRELYRRVRGYQLFISNVEKHRQKFFEKKNMFNEVLPYAIVFGLTKKFADAMKEMGVEPKQASSWYYGTTSLNTALLASHINDFSNSVGTAIASTPSSSGFSSGGSSGGGFGGGGGGSW